MEMVVVGFVFLERVGWKNSVLLGTVSTSWVFLRPSLSCLPPPPPLTPFAAPPPLPLCVNPTLCLHLPHIVYLCLLFSSSFPVIVLIPYFFILFPVPPPLFPSPIPPPPSASLLPPPPPCFSPISSRSPPSAGVVCSCAVIGTILSLYLPVEPYPPRCASGPRDGFN